MIRKIINLAYETKYIVMQGVVWDFDIELSSASMPVLNNPSLTPATVYYHGVDKIA